MYVIHVNLTLYAAFVNVFLIHVNLTLKTVFVNVRNTCKPDLANDICKCV